MKIGDLVVVLYETRKYYIIVEEERQRWLAWFYVFGENGKIRRLPRGQLRLVCKK